MRRRQIAGGSCVVMGVGAYLWLMAAEVVPTALDLTASIGMPTSAPVAWVGLTTAAFAVVFGLDRTFSRKR